MLITPPGVHQMLAWYTTGGVLSIQCTTAAPPPQGPRTGPQPTGAWGHGLALLWNLSWSPNGPVRQEIRARLPFVQCMPV